MKYRIAGVICAILVAALMSQAHACDCTLPVNYGNPQCAAGITAALKGAPTISNGQGQTLNSSVGVGATSTVGDTTATSTGGTAKATGGNSKSSSTSAGGSVSGVSAVAGSSTSAGGSAAGGSASANGNGGSIGAGAGAASIREGDTNVAAPRIPVNTAVAGFQMTTAPCRYAEGLGIQTMPAGGAVGLTFKDHDCMKLGLAQEFYAHHSWEAGDRLMCSIRDVSSVLGDNCLMILTASHQVTTLTMAAPAPTVVTERTYTRAEVDAIVKKVVSK